MVVRVVVSFALAASTAYAAIAQTQPLTVADTPACPKCTVEARTVAVLGTADGPGALSGPRQVLADARERYWAFEFSSPPMVFGGNGEYIRTVGSIGQGPGEFRGAISGMLVPGDSVVVFDAANRRASVIGPDLTMGRLIRMSFAVYEGVAVAWPAAVIGTGDIRTEGAGSSPLHMLSFASRDVAAEGLFGPGDGMARPGASRQTIHRVAAARSGGVWSADAQEYRVTLFSAKGEPVKTLERKPSWFPVPSRGMRFSPNAPPPPELTGLFEDPKSGYLWVYARVPASNWRAAWPAASANATAVSSRSIATEKLYDTRIEVLDPSTGRVVARGSLAGPVVSVLSGNRAAMYEVDADGIPHMRVVALTLRQP